MCSPWKKIRLAQFIQTFAEIKTQSNNSNTFLVIMCIYCYYNMKMHFFKNVNKTQSLLRQSIFIKHISNTEAIQSTLHEAKTCIRMAFNNQAWSTFPLWYIVHVDLFMKYSLSASRDNGVKVYSWHSDVKYTWGSHTIKIIFQSIT